MDIWNRVKGIEEIQKVFGKNIGFHDGEIKSIKYDGVIVSIEIDCKGFLKTAVLFNDKYKGFENIYVKIDFKGVSCFEIDYNYGLNFIDEILIKENYEDFLVIINSYYLKIICHQIEIDKVEVKYNDINKEFKNLDKFLKSNL